MLLDKTFSQLTTTELFQIYRLRAAVFIVAQSRVVQDPDDVDLIARHIFIKDGDAIVAYARVYPADGGVSFGRVVTAASHRGQGLGRELMDGVMDCIRKYFPGNPIHIHAQEQVERFYHQWGFQSEGTPFILAQTPHVKMTHPAI